MPELGGDGGEQPDEGEAQGPDLARGRPGRGRGGDRAPHAARARAARARRTTPAGTRASCSRRRAGTRASWRSPSRWSRGSRGARVDPRRSRARAAACSSARSRAAATWPSSTPRRAAASRSRSTTAAWSARRAAASAARACAWCRATRPTTATWTASPRRTCCAWRLGVRGGARRGARSRRRSARRSRRAGHPVATRPEEVEAARKADLLRCLRRARPGGRRRGRRRRGSATRSRGARSRSSTPTAAPPRTTARACGSAPRWWRAATAAWRPAATRAAATPAGSCSRTTRRRWPSRPRAGRSRCSTPWTPRPGACRWWWATASAACCCTRRSATASRPTPSRSGASVYAGRLGEQLADPFVTAYDDGSRQNDWGSDGIDDEGTPTRRTTVIEDGRLTSYLYDLLRARKDGVESTGNGRRESFRHLPIPRMTNTFFAPGDATPDELIAGVERGLYAVSFGGGQVEPATGDFVFGVSEGYLIEDGKVTAPVRGATLVGQRPRGAAGDRRHRRRPRHRHRLLRQGRPVRAGRRRPAARAHPRADRGRDGAREPRRRRRPRGRGRARRRRQRRRGVGRGVHEPPGARVRGRGREPQRRRRPRRRRARLRGRPLRLRLRHRPLGRGRDASSRGRRARPPRWPTRTSTRACPTSSARPMWTASPRPSSPTGRPSGRSSSRSRWSARRARARASPRSRTPSTRTRRARWRSPTRAASPPRTSATQAWAYASAFAGEGADLMTGLGVGIGRDPAALDPEAIGAEAAERALALVGARQPESRRCPVVLDAFVAASFIGFIGSMLSADAVQRGRSLFAGREGEEVADPALALADDGTDPEGPASAPFDGEGVADPAHRPDRGAAACSASSTTRAPPARRAAEAPATPAAARTARRRRWAPRT